MSVKKLVLWGAPLCLAAGFFLYHASSDDADANPASQPTATQIQADSQDPTLTSVSPEFMEEAAPQTEDEAVPEAEEPVQDTGPWVSQASTSLSAELYDFIEAEGLRYVDTSNFPFDPQTERLLQKLSQSGEILLFDNTEAERLGGLTEKPSDIIADYYGAATEGDAIIATSVTNADGSVHFMVLPVHKKGEDSSLSEDVKLAVALLKQEKETKETL
ncbi:hypothetical protein EUZ85_09785 [Hahella sp. KA22]|uniref:hypothetical protein n=1 Tax=Hahella sp. KA22 TaxID=1628392 RepID=UPI000FDE7C41|nr:hypothetical protein [Hahella sp. KA22]AZZ90996.1 hypothetical protein ENC22_07230 [Hahella sp. KA22]QAY54366.1 hypothetical protein EUZ85_09785 [Hahella sp. KA22]